MWDRFKDTFGIGSGIWNRNGFKDTLVSYVESIQRHFWNWKWNQFGIKMGLKTPWFYMRDRFKDTFGIGSGIDLESE